MTKEPFVSGLPGEPEPRRSIEESLAVMEKIIRERTKKRRHYEIRRVEGTKEADEAA